MKLFRVLFSVVLFVAVCAVASRSANAQYPYGQCGDAFGLLNAYGTSGTLYGLGFVPVPPYYALHPPVYYSYPVARPYGYSPFAYSGNTPTPELAVPPQEILNPHVKPEEKKEAPKPEAKKTSTQITAAPQLILNPFVEARVAKVLPASADIGN